MPPKRKTTTKSTLLDSSSSFSAISSSSSSSSSSEAEEEVVEDVVEWSEYDSDEDDLPRAGYFFCVVCKKDVHEDSFSAARLRGPAKERYCLKHTGTSGFGKSFARPIKLAPVLYAPSDSDDDRKQLKGFVQPDSSDEEELGGRSSKRKSRNKVIIEVEDEEDEDDDDNDNENDEEAVEKDELDEDNSMTPILRAIVGPKQSPAAMHRKISQMVNRNSELLDLSDPLAADEGSSAAPSKQSLIIDSDEEESDEEVLLTPSPTSKSLISIGSGASQSTPSTTRKKQRIIDSEEEEIGEKEKEKEEEGKVHFKKQRTNRSRLSETMNPQINPLDESALESDEDASQVLYFSD